MSPRQQQPAAIDDNDRQRPEDGRQQVHRIGWRPDRQPGHQVSQQHVEREARWVSHAQLRGHGLQLAAVSGQHIGGQSHNVENQKRHEQPPADEPDRPPSARALRLCCAVTPGELIQAQGRQRRPEGPTANSRINLWLDDVGQQQQRRPRAGYGPSRHQPRPDHRRHAPQRHGRPNARQADHLAHDAGQPQAQRRARQVS